MGGRMQEMTPVTNNNRAAESQKMREMTPVTSNPRASNNHQRSSRSSNFSRSSSASTVQIEEMQEVKLPPAETVKGRSSVLVKVEEMRAQQKETLSLRDEAKRAYDPATRGDLLGGRESFLPRAHADEMNYQTTLYELREQRGNRDKIIQDVLRTMPEHSFTQTQLNSLVKHERKELAGQLRHEQREFDAFMKHEDKRWDQYFEQRKKDIDKSTKWLSKDRAEADKALAEEKKMVRASIEEEKKRFRDYKESSIGVLAQRHEDLQDSFDATSRARADAIKMIERIERDGSAIESKAVNDWSFARKARLNIETEGDIPARVEADRAWKAERDVYRREISDRRDAIGGLLDHLKRS